MEHFDDMLRNSLANDFPENRFEFREEYWLQAQALIEAYEAKRKRRAVWWSISSLLLAGAVVLAYYNRDHFMHQPGVAPVVPTPVMPVMENATPANAVPMAQADQSATTPPAPSALTDHPSVPLQQQSGTAPISKTFIHAVNSKGYNSNEPNRALIAENNRIPASASGSSQKTALQYSSADLPAVNEVAPQQETVIPSTQPSVTYTPHLTDEIELISDLPLYAVKSNKEKVLPVIDVIHADHQAPAIPKIHPDPLFRLGVLAAVGTPSGVFVKETPTLAFGLTANYRLNERWTINAGLNWRGWKGESLHLSLDTSHYQSQLDAPSDYTVQQVVRTYSFGYAQTRTTNTVRAFHFLELPLSVERHWGKISAETGAQLSFLVASRSDVEQFQSQSLNTAETKTYAAKTYSGGKSAFVKSFFPGIFAGVNYQPARHWSVGVRGAWRSPSNVVYANVKTSYLSYDNNMSLNRSLTALNAEIRLRWFF